MIRQPLAFFGGVAVVVAIFACTREFARAQQPDKAPPPQPVEDRRDNPYPAPPPRRSPFYLPGYANSPASLDPYSGYGIPPRKVSTKSSSTQTKQGNTNGYNGFLPYFLTYGFNPFFAYGYSHLLQQESEDEASLESDDDGTASMSTQGGGSQRSQKKKKEQRELVGGKTATSTVLNALGLRSDDRGELKWPLGLCILPPAADSQALREQIDSLMRVAAAQAMRGQVSPSILQDAKETVGKLRAQLDDHNDAMAHDTYEQAADYLKKLDRALKALQ